jgi:hypothetical protein
MNDRAPTRVCKKKLPMVARNRPLIVVAKKLNDLSAFDDM